MNGDFSKVFAELKKKRIFVERDVPLSSHTTFRIGGNASVFITPSNMDELLSALKILKGHNIRFFVLGRGSNVLFDDRGYSGAIISTSKLDSIIGDGEKVTAFCGASFTRLASFCAEESLTGLEFAYGIPGSVGGAVYMNAGAYSGEVSQVLSTSAYIDLEDCSLKTLERDDHAFDYRGSAFRNNRWVHIYSTFSLAQGDRDAIHKTMSDFMQRRKDKQPLEYPSAGSTFKRYPGRYTGQMIEEAGLKGLSVGGAQVSEKHAGFIINTGNATSSDVLELINIVKEKIKFVFDVEIECEMIYVKADE